MLMVLESMQQLATPAMKQIKHALAIRLGKRAARMLVAFVNARPDSDGIRQFERAWEPWPGGEQAFLWVQSIVLKVWEGDKRGIEGFQIEAALGLHPQRDDDRPIEPPICVDWDTGSLLLTPTNLSEIVWLALLQHSKRLALCANRNNDCPTPYFLKWRPNQRFCSAECAEPDQREYKRRWWRDHGTEWRKAQKKTKKRKARKGK